MPALYPVFDPPLTNDYFDGRSLSSDLDELDKIAAPAGFDTLSSFVDAFTMALEVLEECELPENCSVIRWHPAQAGLTTVQRLLTHFDQLSETTSQNELALVAELKHLEALLEQAKSQSFSFHLLVDI